MYGNSHGAATWSHANEWQLVVIYYYLTYILLKKKVTAEIKLNTNDEIKLTVKYKLN